MDATDGITRGLQNVGNTCFLNSTVQALASIPAVHEWCTSILSSYTAARAAAGEQVEGNREGTDATDAADLLDPEDDEFSEYDDEALSDEERFVSLAKLLALFRALCWPVRPEDARALIPSLPLEALPAHIREHASAQHDAHELLVGLVEAMEGRIGVQSLVSVTAEARALCRAQVPHCGQVRAPEAQGHAGPVPARPVRSPLEGCRRTWASCRVRMGSRTSYRVAPPSMQVQDHCDDRPQPRQAGSPGASWSNPFACLVARRRVCLSCLERAGGSPSVPGCEGANPAWTVTCETVLTLPPCPSIGGCLRDLCKDEPIHRYSCGTPGCDGQVGQGRIDAMALLQGGGRGRADSLPNAISQTRIVRRPQLLALHVNRLQGTYGRMAVGALHFDQTLSLGRDQHCVFEMPTMAAPAPHKAPPAPHYELMSVVAHRAFDSAGTAGHYVAYRRRPVPVTAGAVHETGHGHDGRPTAGAAAVPRDGDQPAHHTTAASSAHQWVQCDDKRTKLVSFEAVRKDPGSYILLYQATPEDRVGGKVSSAGQGPQVHPARLLAACAREEPAHGGWLPASDDNGQCQRSASYAAWLACPAARLYEELARARAGSAGHDRAVCWLPPPPPPSTVATAGGDVAIPIG